MNWRVKNILYMLGEVKTRKEILRVRCKTAGEILQFPGPFTKLYSVQNRLSKQNYRTRRNKPKQLSYHYFLKLYLMRYINY